MPLPQISLEEMPKHPKLMAGLLALAKRETNMEGFLFYFDKGNMAGVHPKYVKVGAPKEVNISSKLRSQMQAHYDKGEEPQWNALAEKAESEVRFLILPTVRKFYKTEGYVRPMLESNLKKAVKLLGIEAPQQAGLMDCLVAFHTGGDTAGIKKLGPFLKKAKIMIEVKIIMNNLKKAGLI